MKAWGSFPQVGIPRLWIKAIYAIPLVGEMQGFSSRYPPNPTPRMREPLRFRQITLALLELLFLQLQGLGRESPIHPGRQQSQPEDDKGDGDNSGRAKGGDAYAFGRVRGHVGELETGGGHVGVMHDRDGGAHHEGSC